MDDFDQEQVHIKPVQFPPITEVRSWLSEVTITADQPLIDLCKAVPDYPPSPELVDHLRERLDDPMTSRYSQDEAFGPDLQTLCFWPSATSTNMTSRLL